MMVAPISIRRASIALQTYSDAPRLEVGEEHSGFVMALLAWIVCSTSTHRCCLHSEIARRLRWVNVILAGAIAWMLRGEMLQQSRQRHEVGSIVIQHASEGAALMSSEIRKPSSRRLRTRKIVAAIDAQEMPLNR